MQQLEKISWDHQSYLIGGERQFLISGEFHYFRVPQQDWRRRLRLWKAAGGNAVTTYVPWLTRWPPPAPHRGLLPAPGLCCSA